jgi:MFS family permease
MVQAGLVLTGAGMALVAATLIPVVPALIALLAWGLTGLGMGLAYSTISLVVLETAPGGQEGTAAAAMQLANVLGSALGAGIGGVIIAYSGAEGGELGLGIAIQDVLMIGVIALALLTAIRLPGRRV